MKDDERRKKHCWLVVKEKAGQVFRMRITDRYEISDSINGEIITDWRTQGMDAKTDGRRAAKDFSWIVNTDQSLYRLGPTLHFKPLPGAFANCGQSNVMDKREEIVVVEVEKRRDFTRQYGRGGNTFEHRLVFDEEQWRKVFRLKGIDRVNLTRSIVLDREIYVCAIANGDFLQFYNYNVWHK